MPRKSKILIGLGNIGLNYKNTRHNVGFSLLDLLAKEKSLVFKKEKLYEIALLEEEELSLVLVKPSTFMNLSGKVLSPLLLKYHFNIEEDLLVITDNIDLSVGRVRLKVGSSGSTHNGLRSINEAIGNKSYHRLLIGVGSVPPLWQLSNWVLSSFSQEEKKILDSLYSFLSCELTRPFSKFSELVPAVNSYRTQ